MAMISHDLVVCFANESKFNNPKHIHVDLVWIKNTKPKFEIYFELKETNENITMVSLRGKATLEKFLDYHGHTFAEAIERFNMLKYFHEYRIKNNNSKAYINVGDIEIFYQEIESGNKPEYVDLSLIEHY